jgi:curved DNA-binding protein CbpA
MNTPNTDTQSNPTRIPAASDLDRRRGSTGISTSTGLMNPQEYQQGLSKLRHYRMQKDSAARTYTETNIAQAELVHDMVSRTEHGQKAEIYEAAGLSHQEVSKDLAVGAMLSNRDSNLNLDTLPSHSVLRIAAASTVPDETRREILAQPDITVSAARTLIAEAAPKQAARPVKPSRASTNKGSKPVPKGDAYIIQRQLDDLDRTGLAIVSNALRRRIGEEGADYALLGLLPTCSDDLLHSAIRLAQREHHPDRGGDATEFARTQAAIERLQAARPRRVEKPVSLAELSRSDSASRQSLIDSLAL